MISNENSEVTEVPPMANEDEICKVGLTHSNDSDPDDENSWLDVHTLNYVPYKNVKKIEVTCVKGGRATPLPYPDPLADYDDFAPIDGRLLNVDPGQPAFSFLARLYDAGVAEALPHPDPLAAPEECDDRS